MYTKSLLTLLILICLQACTPQMEGSSPMKNVDQDEVSLAGASSHDAVEYEDTMDYLQTLKRREAIIVRAVPHRILSDIYELHDQLDLGISQDHDRGFGDLEYPVVMELVDIPVYSSTDPVSTFVLASARAQEVRSLADPDIKSSHPTDLMDLVENEEGFAVLQVPVDTDFYEKQNAHEILKDRIVQEGLDGEYPVVEGLTAEAFPEGINHMYLQGWYKIDQDAECVELPEETCMPLDEFEAALKD